MSYLGDLRNAEIPYDKSLVNINIDDYFTKAEKDEFLNYVEALCSNYVSYNGIDNPKYQELVDRNRETALQMGSWDIRMKQIMEWLRGLGYEV